MDTGKPETALVDEKLVQTNLGDNPKHIQLAVRAAQESVVMLANGGNTLPLDPTKIKKLLVLGVKQSICLLESSSVVLALQYDRSLICLLQARMPTRSGQEIILPLDGPGVLQMVEGISTIKTW
jgi:beta-glucosidase-like glycosyl hydrolase